MNKRRRRIGKFRRLAKRRIMEGKWIEEFTLIGYFMEYLTPKTVVGYVSGRIEGFV